MRYGSVVCFQLHMKYQLQLVYIIKDNNVTYNLFAGWTQQLSLVFEVLLFKSAQSCVHLITYL